jgi:hypothetical protein
LTVGEFIRSIDSLATQLRDVADTSTSTLGEARKTNGRVNVAESKIARLEQEMLDTSRKLDGCVTTRDFRVGIGVVVAVEVALRVLPPLFAVIGKGLAQ